MKNQNHIIKKQILEITLQSEENSFRIQNEISRIYRENVVPIINMRCDELCDPDITYRQDRLEIDLGVINIDNLEAEFTEKISNKVYQAIDEVAQAQAETSKTTTTPPDDIRKNTSKKPTGSSFELFTYFFQTGVLPWWAGKVSKQEFIKRFDDMLTESPENAVAIIQECLPNSNQFARFIYQLPDTTLVKALHTQTPSHSELIGALANDIINTFNQSNLSKKSSVPKIRALVWQSVLHDIFAPYSSGTGIKHILHNIISSLTTFPDFAYSDLKSEMIKTASFLTNSGTVFKSNLPEILVNKSETDDAGDSVKGSAKDKTVNKAHGELLNMLTRLKEFQKQFALTSDFNIGVENVISIIHSALLPEKLKVEIVNLLEALKLFKFRDAVTEIIKGLKVEKKAIDKFLQKTQGNINKIVDLDHDATLMSLLNELNNRKADIELLIKQAEQIETPGNKTIFENKEQLIREADLVVSAVNSASDISFSPEIKELLNSISQFLQPDTSVNDKNKIIKALRPKAQSVEDCAKKSYEKIEHPENTKSLKKLPLSNRSVSAFNDLKSGLSELIRNLHENIDLETKQQILKKHENTGNIATQNYSQDLFTESDELYINNAGIVILWSYLNRFFQTIGLVKENAFINKESAQRGALFLEYLANGATDIGEYDLPLNKILCGIDLEEAIEGQLEITDEEKLQCENLLEFVIKNWPVLKQTSIDGLRRAFLQRQGSISPHDNGRLVRVEHQTHDILLDKLPWSIRVIKLPWMDAIVYVEW